MLRRFRILERKIEHEEECNMEYYQYHFGPMNIGHEIMVSKYSFFSKPFESKCLKIWSFRSKLTIFSRFGKYTHILIN